MLTTETGSMYKTLVVAMETVEKHGLSELLERCYVKGCNDTYEEEKVSDVKILAESKKSVTMKALSEIVACGQTVDVEILVFADEREKFFLLGAVLTKDEKFVFDEAFGSLPSDVAKKYEIKVLSTKDAKKSQASTKKSTTKASNPSPTTKKDGSKKEDGDKESVKEGKNSATTSTKKNSNAQDSSEPPIDVPFQMSFENMLFAKGIKTENIEPLREVFQTSKDRDVVRKEVMERFGLKAGGSILAKLDGNFARLHELATKNE